MKNALCLLILLWSSTCFAQIKDANFKVISTKDLGIEGVVMTIDVKVKGWPDDEQTVIYYLIDYQSKPILHSKSDRNGVIDLYISNFKYIKYVYIGGPGHITTRIDLTKFKGKNVLLDLVVEPDLRLLID